METSQPKCGFCTAPAAVYGGFAGANSWACYACATCSQQRGFQVWDRLSLTAKATA